jgi:hypothetical protein
LRSGPCSERIDRPGAKRAASFFQLKISEVGRTISAGRSSRPGFLFEQQVRQRLGRLAETHVVGENSREILFAQELQPGQTLGLVVTQFQPQSGRRVDVADSLRGRQLLGERQHITLAP